MDDYLKVATSSAMHGFFLSLCPGAMYRAGSQDDFPNLSLFQTSSFRNFRCPKFLVVSVLIRLGQNLNDMHTAIRDVYRRSVQSIMDTFSILLRLLNIREDIKKFATCVRDVISLWVIRWQGLIKQVIAIVHFWSRLLSVHLEITENG